ncbi:peptidoglycan recognition protein family protein [Gemmatimonas groenlandica]|uniref:N-acetylmuramoyl-L-alanine amidase n=1 Tax=Gemmatimonas groenlandica TaxID=2732249 RepID=A0A6M4IQM6_9BACT|nr:peptidoglycan recognition family protein [Gemmatimonas groenlandica]QJR37224.1 N-acetylmuramoyl-L-alanine amidase [Gemmatimonas groenlandica]
MRFFPLLLVGLCALVRATALAAQPSGPPSVIPHSVWQAKPPLGISADAARRNKKAGDSLSFRELTVTVLQTLVDSSGAKPVDVARVKLATTAAGKGVSEERLVREGAAFNWRTFHIAVVAVYGPGELGAGLVALEVATLASLPASIANAVVAGGADMRLRIPHIITHVTLHHTGDSKPLTRADDPAQRLRNLQSWGASDRNWWDVPYHFLLDLDGRAFEGRDWHFQGETNTTYDPGGHFLISMIGNYDVQEPSVGQLDAIADLMAWALKANNLPIDRIGGHYNYAETGCPGKYLRRYLEDGTLRRMVQQRLNAR